jgi:hypothetical protein
MEAVMRPFNFSDPKCFNSLLFGSLLSLVPILGAIMVVGYHVEYVRKILTRDEPEKIPDLSSVSVERVLELARKGLNFFLGLLVYTVIMGVMDVLIFLPFIGSAAMVLSKMKDSDGAAGCLAVLTAFVIPLSLIFLVGLAFSMVLPILQILYARSSLGFGDSFQVGEAISLIMSDLGGYFTSVIALFVAGLVAMTISGFLSLLGAIPILGWIVMAAVNAFIYFTMGLVATSVFSEFYIKNRGASDSI